MKILKLKKDELESLQELYDEMHGMELTLKTLSIRRLSIEQDLKEILRKATKKYMKCRVCFKDGGKIKIIKIIDE